MICSNLYQLDKTAPSLDGVSDVDMVSGDEINLTMGINANDSLSGIKDSYTYAPTSIDTSVIDRTTVIYRVSDQAGNEIVKNRMITILIATNVSYFTFDTSSKTITGYSTSGPKNVVIPPMINGLSVENIGANAFKGKSLTSVTIPNSVINIGDGAFQQNQITNVTMSKRTLSIGQTAFVYNQLSNIEIPSSVTRIGQFAFANNQLTHIRILDGVRNIEERVFNENQLPDNQAFIYKRNNDGFEDKTTIISYGGAKRENVVIPNGVQTIEKQAFNDCKITGITIPTSVTMIGLSAFSYNQLSNITIPSGVTRIEDFTFRGNKLSHVVIPSSVTAIGIEAFANNQLTDVIIPNSVTSIGNLAFSTNQLSSIIIPANVTSIGNNAFLYNQLSNVKIIGKSASNQFTVYGAKIWGWKTGYTDSNITWNATP